MEARNDAERCGAKRRKFGYRRGYLFRAAVSRRGRKHSPAGASRCRTPSGVSFTLRPHAYQWTPGVSGSCSMPSFTLAAARSAV